MPQISVLTTNYNRENYIAEAIESVLGQTFTDFEYIIVDDCSTDKSWEIIQKYASCDQRIRAYRNEHNLGDYPNRNIAASYARGKYIKYLDSDDLLYQHCLQVMIAAAEKYPEAAVVMAVPVQIATPYPVCFSPYECFQKHFLQGLPILGRAPLSALIRIDAFEKVGKFSGKRYVGDQELWHKLALKYSFVIVPGCLAWAREHMGQEGKNERKIPIVMMQRIKVEFETFASNDFPLSLSEKNVLIHRYEWLAVHHIVKTFTAFHIRDALQMKNTIGFSIGKCLAVIFKQFINKFSITK